MKDSLNAMLLPTVTVPAMLIAAEYSGRPDFMRLIGEHGVQTEKSFYVPV